MNKKTWCLFVALSILIVAVMQSNCIRSEGYYWKRTVGPGLKGITIKDTWPESKYEDICAFSIELNVKCHPKGENVQDNLIEYVQVYGFGDWDVDDNGNDQSQEMAKKCDLTEKNDLNETDNYDGSMGTFTKVDFRGNGDRCHNKSLEAETINKGKTIVKGEDFSILVRYKHFTSARGEIIAYPLDFDGNQIATIHIRQLGLAGMSWMSMVTLVMVIGWRTD